MKENKIMTINKILNQKTLQKRIIIFIITLCFILVLPGCSKKDTKSEDSQQSNTELNENNIAQNESTPHASQNETNDTEVDIEHNPISLEVLAEEANRDLSASFTIGMIGDVLFHDWLILGGLQEDGTYNYPYIYEYLEPDVNNLDFAMFNMEGTYRPPCRISCFSAPSELANSMEKCF